MKLTWITSAALILMLPVGLAEAGQGEICYSSSLPVSQANPVTNDTKFACPSLGEVTIPEIYQFGWRVSQLDHRGMGGDESDPLNSQTAWMILIEML